MKNYLNIINKIPRRYQVAAAGWISRFFMGFSQIISIAILLNYLGTNLYAVFALFIGLQGWFVLADCGVGSSLQNYISEARANNKNLHLLLSNAAIVIWIMLIVISLMFVCVSPFLQYLLLHKIAPELAVSHSYLLILAGVLFIATTVFGISYRIFLANHRGYWAYFYQGIGPVFSVLAIILIKHLDIEHFKLPMVLLAWLFPQFLASFFSYLHSFPLKNVLQYLDLKTIKEMLLRGIKFWMFAVSGAFTLLMDYIIMSQTLTDRDIVIYNILFRGFCLILFIYTAILTAIWPEMSELFIKKQWIKANGILRNNMIIGMFFVIFCSMLFLFFRHYVISILAPKSTLVLPATAIILFGVYAVTRVWSDSYATALQSQNYLKIFLIYVPVQAVISVVGMYFLSLHFGLNGILLGLILCFLVTSVWLLPIIYFKRKVFYT